MKTTFERLQAVIGDVMNLGPDRISPDTHIEGDLGPDSLEKVEIAMAIEKEFEIDLADDVVDYGTVKEIVTRIDTAIEQRCQLEMSAV